MDKLFIGQFDKSMIQDISEFSKRYSGSWIYNETDNKPVKIEAANGTIVNLCDPYYNIETIQAVTNKVYSVRLPTLGFFNGKTSFYYGVRVPSRQYKRGICSQNYNIIDSIKSLLNKTICTITTQEGILYAYKETKTLILNAIKELNEPNIIGRVLNKEFAVSLNTLSPEQIYLLWYKNKPVAEIYPNSGTIKVKYKHVKQEIIDYNKYIESKQWKII